MKKELLLLFLIIVVAAFLRFYQLGDVAPSLTWDEVSWGYNAYSLGLDGKDEFGKFLPVTYLESFGDFKPPLYAYLSVLPVKLFGLTEFGTRFASAFFGTLSVLLTYFLTKQIFKKNSKHDPSTSLRARIRNSKQMLSFAKASEGKQDSNPQNAIHSLEILPLLATGMLAISPWHILLSRAAFEANAATFFIVLGVLLFLIAMSISRDAATNPHPVWKSTLPLCLSMLSFVLSMYTFNTARIVAPFLVFGFFVACRNKLLSIRSSVFTAVVVGGIIFLPLGLFLLTPQSKLRFQEVNIFSDLSVIQRVNQEVKNDSNVWWSGVLHNRRFAYTIEYVKHYFDNFNPWFLFVRGDGNPKFSIQDVGEMYIWEIPFFIAGIFLLFKKREGVWWIIPYWMIVGIIPAAFARETPHALRIEAALPTFQILSAYGLFYLTSKISNITLRLRSGREYQIKYFIFVLCFSFFIFNFLYFIHNYYVHYPKEFSGEWQYGYKQAIEYTKSVENQFDKIYFTEELGRPYVYTLFYLQYNPDKFRKEATIEREVYGFVHVRGFGKYIFVKDFEKLSSEGRILYIDVPSKVPESASIQNTFYLLNGEKVLVAYIL